MNKRRKVFLGVSVVAFIFFGIFIVLQFLSPFPLRSSDAYRTKMKGEYTELRGRGFTFEYPADWYFEEDSFNKDSFSIDLDPPGEGPNPYSNETGDGTNPFDDIYIYYFEDDLEEWRIANAHEQYNLTELTIDGHSAIHFNDLGESVVSKYIVQVDGTHLLSFSTEKSHDYLNAILATIRFDLCLNFICRILFSSF